MWRRVGMCALAVAAICGSVDLGRAAGFFEMNFYLSGPRYSAKVPLCEDAGPLREIQIKFHSKEGIHWNSDLEIVQFEGVREVSFRPWVDAAIPRRFCQATALVSDGVRRPVYYSIIEDAGLIGASYGIEWCMVGLDRNWAYSPACKMAKP